MRDAGHLAITPGELVRRVPDARALEGARGAFGSFGDRLGIDPPSPTLDPGPLGRLI